MLPHLHNRTKQHFTWAHKISVIREQYPHCLLSEIVSLFAKSKQTQRKTNYHRLLQNYFNTNSRIAYASTKLIQYMHPQRVNASSSTNSSQSENLCITHHNYHNGRSLWFIIPKFQGVDGLVTDDNFWRIYFNWRQLQDPTLTHTASHVCYKVGGSVLVWHHITLFDGPKSSSSNHHNPFFISRSGYILWRLPLQHVRLYKLAAQLTF